MVKVRNFTPHPITIIVRKGENMQEHTDITLPSEGNARVSVTEKMVSTVDSGQGLVDYYVEEFGQVEGLPDPEPNTVLIVSRLVYDACPDRDDLVYPVGLLRDELGRVIGCRGLSLPRSLR